MEVAQLTAATRGETMRFEVSPGETATVGRSSKCSVRLKDPKVSRVHCQLVFAGGRLAVTDLDSTTGLMHRGLPSKQFVIEVGDGFHLGETFVRFDACGATAAAAAPQAPAAVAPTPPPPPTPPPAAAPATAPTPAPKAEPERPRIAPLAAGATLGRFTVEAVLGRGARSTVYRARQLGLQRSVALRVFDVAAGAADIATLRSAFLADVQRAATRTGPFLVPVLDGGELDGTCFAALELMRGRSLAAAVGDGRRLPWAKLVPVLVDATRALALLHADGIGHGAVTPGNVFVLDAGGGMLADPRHDAPFDAGADLRALAAVAHLALTGEPPPGGLRTPQRVPSLRGIDASLPAALDQLLCNLLAADPAVAALSANEVRARLLDLTAAPALSPAAPAPTPVAAPVPRLAADDYPDLGAETGRLQRKPPPPAKAFAARLCAELIVFSIHLVIAIVVLVLMKKAAGFDIYRPFGM